MDLEYSDDQRMLKDMVERFIADDYSFEARQQLLRAGANWSRGTWAKIAELGLLMVPVTAERGGMATSGVEAMIVGEAFGRGLLLEPWLATVVAAALLDHCGAGEAEALLGALMAGETLFSGKAKTSLVLNDGVLSGDVPFMLAGASADCFVLSVNDAAGDPHVVLVDGQAPGISSKGYTISGYGEGAHTRFRDASVLAVLASGEKAVAASRAAHAAGVAAVAADALGAAQSAFDMTVEYLKTRVQFGEKIGANQALQHRAAEMFVELEQLRSAALYAACTLDAEAQERAKAMAAVRIVTAKTARFISQSAVQLHGGIGVTDEHAVGHCFLRLTADMLLFGDGEDNADRLASLGGFVSERPYWESAA